MDSERVKLLAWLTAITLFSGLADAKGFLHASRIWQEERLIWPELGKSALGFGVGIGAYWLSLRYLKALGAGAPEVQSLAWFGVTLIGLAALSGKAFRWPLADQAVALLVLAGVGRLMYRSGT